MLQDASGRDQPLVAAYRAEPLRRELARVRAEHGTLAGLPLRALMAGLLLERVPDATTTASFDCDTWEDISAARARIREHGNVLDEWITAVKAELGIELDVDTAALLDLARDAAHGVARPAAPLTTFLIGYAAGQQGRDVQELTDRAAALANRWVSRGRGGRRRHGCRNEARGMTDGEYDGAFGGEPGGTARYGGPDLGRAGGRGTWRSVDEALALANGGRTGGGGRNGDGAAGAGAATGRVPYATARRRHPAPPPPEAAATTPTPGDPVDPAEPVAPQDPPNPSTPRALRHLDLTDATRSTRATVTGPERRPPAPTASRPLRPPRPPSPGTSPRGTSPRAPYPGRPRPRRRRSVTRSAVRSPRPLPRSPTCRRSTPRRWTAGRSSGPGPWRLDHPADAPDGPPPGILAGHAPTEVLPDGHAIRIATGARIPSGATAVLRSEHGEVRELGDGGRGCTRRGPRRPARTSARGARSAAAATNCCPPAPW